jgi:two-component system NarL family response regulator
LRVFIADDHAVFREALAALLSRTPDIEVAGEIERADDLTSAIDATRCDILLLDLKMDRWVTEKIVELAKLTRVGVLTGSERDEDVVTCMRLGARAVVHKTLAAETVKHAIRAVASGRVWVPEAAREGFSARAELARPSDLTEREAEVVRYVAVGLRNAEIARTMSITKETVKIHVNNIFRKVNAKDHVQLALYAISKGLISPPKPV